MSYTLPRYRVSFTAMTGHEAEIVGDEAAVRAIEEIFERAGVKFNEQIGTWDEGFYEVEKRHEEDQD